jgi:hypothetical protein
VLEVGTFRALGPRRSLFGRLEFLAFPHEAWLLLLAFPGGFLFVWLWERVDEGGEWVSESGGARMERGGT